jgi:hypothetical protein
MVSPTKNGDDMYNAERYIQRRDLKALREIFRTEAYISPQETGGGGFV